MKPLISVVIPTCNRSGYLRETLQSVLRQDYENLEILVSDNASKDDTAALVTEMSRADPRIRYRRNLVRTPLISHFNQCIAEARGEYFVLLSDDDRVNETFVSSLAQALLANPRATVALPLNAIIDETGTVVRTLPAPKEQLFEGIDFVIDWLWRRREIPVANFVTLMAKTDTVRKLRYQPFPHGLNSDNLLFLQLALSGQVAFAPSATFFWRVHDRQQGNQIPARNVRAAGRDFQRFVRRDRPLKRLIRSHLPRQQILVRHGIDRMIAEAYLQNIGFFDKPCSPQTIRALLSHRPNAIYLRLILRQFYNRLRHAIPSRPMSAANA